MWGMHCGRDSLQSDRLTPGRGLAPAHHTLYLLALAFPLLISGDLGGRWSVAFPLLGKREDRCD